MSVEPYQLSATEATARIERGQLSAEALVRSCLERIGERNGIVQAWAFIDPDQAISAARQSDAGTARGPLRGIPVGVKDIIDTADQPTAYGSPIYGNHRPAADAACVALLRRAGGLVIGKTATTEFAYRHPSPCTNPHDPAHTPGGSSSGSAAAVADRMVPLGIGTQTAGSVIRPASFCGVYGLMPGLGEISCAGVRHLAESFDTVGLMARSLDDLALFRSVLQGVTPRPVRREPQRTPRLAVRRSDFWEEADPDARAAFEDAVARLARAGAVIEDIDEPGRDRPLHDAFWTVLRFEGARALAPDLLRDAAGLSIHARELIEEGEPIGLDACHEAKRQIETARFDLQQRFADFDGVLTLAATGEAPHGLDDTGASTFNFLWPLAQMPAVTLPLLEGRRGLPIGLQIVGARRSEDRILTAAAWIEQHFEQRS